MRLKDHLDKVGTFGAIVSAALAPCCFPLLGVIATSLGLGAFEKFSPQLQYAVQVFVILAVVGSMVMYRAHRRSLPFILSIIGAILCFIHYYLIFSEPLIYTGFTLLVVSGFWNTHEKKKINSCKTPLLESTITCPECGHQKMEIMPTNACLFFWNCPKCGVKLKPKEGDCCVFCSFGNVACPPIQLDQGCCG
jgi:hypothetical protein